MFRLVAKLKSGCIAVSKEMDNLEDGAWSIQYKINSGENRACIEVVELTPNDVCNNCGGEHVYKFIAYKNNNATSIIRILNEYDLGYLSQSDSLYIISIIEKIKSVPAGGFLE